MADLRIQEIDDGPDFVLNSNDLDIIEGFQNMPYLGLFGGNVESNTKEFEIDEQRNDCWMNNLLFPEDSSIQFNSNLQRLLMNIELSSFTLFQINETIKDDLKFMEEFSSIEVNTSILNVNRLEISILVVENPNTEGNEFIFIWDSTKQELILTN